MTISDKQWLLDELQTVDVIQCPCCGEEVSTDDDEGIDLLTMHGEHLLTCPYCGDEFMWAPEEEEEW